MPPRFPLTRDELNRRAHDDNRAWLRDMDELLGDGWVPEVFPEDAGWPAQEAYALAQPKITGV